MKRILTIIFCVITFSAVGQIRINQLPTADTINGAEYVPISKNGITKKTTIQSISGNGNFWNLTGNKGTDPNTNFIGTTDNNPIYFRTNNNIVGGFLKIGSTDAFAVTDSMGIGLIFASSDNNGDITFQAGDLDNHWNHTKISVSDANKWIRFRGLSGSKTIIETDTLQYLTSAGKGKVLTSDSLGNASWQGAVYGAYYDTLDQVNKGATVENYIHCNSTFEQSGVTKTNDSTFTVSQDGVYEISFTAQCSKTDGGVDDVRFYLKQDGGSGYPFTSGIVGLANANATHAATWTWLKSLIAGDTIHILWQSEDTDLFLDKVERGTTPNTPAVPSVTIGIKKIK